MMLKLSTSLHLGECLSAIFTQVCAVIHFTVTGESQASPNPKGDTAHRTQRVDKIGPRRATHLSGCLNLVLSKVGTLLIGDLIPHRGDLLPPKRRKAPISCKRRRQNAPALGDDLVVTSDDGDVIGARKNGARSSGMSSHIPHCGRLHIANPGHPASLVTSNRHVNIRCRHVPVGPINRVTISEVKVLSGDPSTDPVSHLHASLRIRLTKLNITNQRRLSVPTNVQSTGRMGRGAIVCVRHQISAFSSDTILKGDPNLPHCLAGAPLNTFVMADSRRDRDVSLRGVYGHRSATTQRGGGIILDRLLLTGHPGTRFNRRRSIIKGHRSSSVTPDFFVSPILALVDLLALGSP